jgi:hypothetical protein
MIISSFGLYLVLSKLRLRGSSSSAAPALHEVESAEATGTKNAELIASKQSTPTNKAIKASAKDWSELTFFIFFLQRWGNARLGKLRFRDY